MFRKLEDFLRNWQYEAGATQRIFDSLTDESLKLEVTQDGRTLGRIAWHMVTSIQFLMSQTGLKFESPKISDDVPNSVEIISKSFLQVNDAFLNAVKTQWNDETLTVFNNLFGTDLPNGVTLLLLSQHQTHHRGQITILMRQAGLKVPGVYGPAKEEWSNIGMDAPQ